MMPDNYRLPVDAAAFADVKQIFEHFDRRAHENDKISELANCLFGESFDRLPCSNELNSENLTSVLISGGDDYILLRDLIEYEKLLKNFQKQESDCQKAILSHCSQMGQFFHGLLYCNKPAEILDWWAAKSIVRLQDAKLIESIPFLPSINLHNPNAQWILSYTFKALLENTDKLERLKLMHAYSIHDSIVVKTQKSMNSSFDTIVDRFNAGVGFFNKHRVGFTHLGAALVKFGTFSYIYYVLTSQLDALLMQYPTIRLCLLPIGYEITAFLIDEICAIPLNEIQRISRQFIDASIIYASEKIEIVNKTRRTYSHENAQANWVEKMLSLYQSN